MNFYKQLYNYLDIVHIMNCSMFAQMPVQYACATANSCAKVITGLNLLGLGINLLIWIRLFIDSLVPTYT